MDPKVLPALVRRTGGRGGTRRTGGRDERATERAVRALVLRSRLRTRGAPGDGSEVDARTARGRRRGREVPCDQRGLFLGQVHHGRVRDVQSVPVTGAPAVGFALTLAFLGLPVLGAVARLVRRGAVFRSADPVCQVGDLRGLRFLGGHDLTARGADGFGGLHERGHLRHVGGSARLRVLERVERVQGFVRQLVGLLGGQAAFGDCGAQVLGQVAAIGQQVQEVLKGDRVHCALQSREVVFTRPEASSERSCTGYSVAWWIP
jgi:hypothetical protein